MPRLVLIRLAAITLLALAACSEPHARPSAAPVSFGPRRTVATLAPTPAGPPTSAITPSVQELAVGDLTGDGRPDLVVTRVRWSSTETYLLSILAGDGQGGFRDETAALFDGAVPRTQQPRQTILADFNGDHRLDLFVADTGVDVAPYPGYPSVLAVSSDRGRLVDASANLAAWPGYTHSAAAGDIDGDGDVDLFLGQFSPRLLVNDGTAHFVDATERLPELVRSADLFARSALVDVDGRRGVDLVLLGHGSAPNVVLPNDGRGHFTQRPIVFPSPRPPFGATAIGTAIRPIDLNGDHRLDLLLGWTKSSPFYKGRWIQVLINTGRDGFRDETQRRLPQIDNLDQWAYDVVTADIDGNGSADIGLDMGPTFADPARSIPPVFFRNRGSGTFAPVAASTFAEPPFGQFRLVDVDGDRLTDVVSARATPAGEETYAVSPAGRSAR